MNGLHTTSGKNKSELWKAAGIGFAAGTANGLFGAGGGLLLVPGLLRVCRLDAQTAMPTSIAIILPMCAASLISYSRAGVAGPDWWLLAGGLVGGIAGGLLYSRVPKLWLRRALGILILYSAVRMLII
ncbi:MAG: TSUP family transporter [Clostridiaceae bacterium]|nr:TSUP family transporter [Clostridiaceae bacterium]